MTPGEEKARVTTEKIIFHFLQCRKAITEEREHLREIVAGYGAECKKAEREAAAQELDQFAQKSLPGESVIIQQCARLVREGARGDTFTAPANTPTEVLALMSRSDLTTGQMLNLAFERGEKAGMEKAAQICKHFAEDELTPQEWPKYGLCAREKRFDYGAVAATANNLATAIREAAVEKAPEAK